MSKVYTSSKIKELPKNTSTIEGMDLSKNDSQRLVYIPSDLQEWYADHASASGKKINEIIKDALVHHVIRTEKEIGLLEEVNMEMLDTLIYRGAGRYLADNEVYLRRIIKEEIEKANK